MQDDQGNYIPMRYGCQRLSNIQNEAGYPGFTCYYIGRVLLEYLFDVKGLSFDEVMAPDIRDTDTLRELIAAYEAGTPWQLNVHFRPCPAREPAGVSG